MNESSITIPRMTIWAAALGTTALLCVAPFTLPRVSPPEMQTGIIKPVVAARPLAQPLIATKLPKPSAAHRKVARPPALETLARADAPEASPNDPPAAGN